MNTEKAILAGGCFWGMENLIRHVPGDIGFACALYFLQCRTECSSQFDERCVALEFVGIQLEYDHLRISKPIIQRFMIFVFAEFIQFFTAINALGAGTAYRGGGMSET
jgi:peptide methionine sulfoxide reductase MsrA